MDLIKNRNYYYRLASYRKNFKKDETTNKYHNCDFAHLADLASIDVYLREYLLSLCLDLEHAAKTELMKIFTMNQNEDGYEFVERYFKDYPNDHKAILISFEKSKYLSDMRTKRKKISIWVLLEIVNFGQLLNIIECYSMKYNNRRIDSLNRNLMYIKNIRNSCAHNNIFIINLYDESLFIHNPTSSVVSIAYNMKIDRKIIQRAKLHDLLVLFYYHREFCSRELNERRYKEGVAVLERMNKRKELYDNVDSIKGFFKYFSLV